MARCTTLVIDQTLQEHLQNMGERRRGMCKSGVFDTKPAISLKWRYFIFFQNGDHRRLAFLFEKFKSREGQEVHLRHCVKFSGDRSNSFSDMVIFYFFFKVAAAAMLYFLNLIFDSQTVYRASPCQIS